MHGSIRAHQAGLTQRVSRPSSPGNGTRGFGRLSCPIGQQTYPVLSQYLLLTPFPLLLAFTSIPLYTIGSPITRPPNLSETQKISSLRADISKHNSKPSLDFALLNTLYGVCTQQHKKRTKELFLGDLLARTDKKIFFMPMP